MRKLVVHGIKGVMDCFPRSIKRHLGRLSVLRGWYRKNLNEHYFDSYSYDSEVKHTHYQSWIAESEPNLMEADPVETKAKWLLVIHVSPSNLNKLSVTLSSVNDLYDVFPELVIVGSTKNIEEDISAAISGLNPTVSCTSILVGSDDGCELEHFSREYFVSVLCSGDRLSPYTYRELNATVLNNPRASLIYSDHDYVDEVGVRKLPQLKPSWNYDLCLSTNYIGRSGFWRMGHIQPYSAIFSSDHIEENLLAATLVSSEVGSDGAVAIAHVPKVLFHLDASLSQVSEGEVSCTDHAANIDEGYRITVLQGHLESKVRCIQATDFLGCVRLQWQLPQEEPLVSIIIPTKNARKLVKICIESILEKSDYSNFEIILVDNQSDEPASLKYFERLNMHPKVQVVRYPHPFNYSAINNFAVTHANGEVIALVNNDIEVIDSNWLSELISHALRPGVGCVGAKLFYSDNTIQHAGVVIGYGGVAGHAHKHFPMHHPGYMNRLQAVHNLSAVTAACLVVKKSIYEEVGGLDEENLTVAFNDVDFCLKIQAQGYRNVWTPYARLYHHESVSRGSDQSGEKLKRFESEIAFMKKKWKTDICCDPAYNPNLTLKREDFSLKEMQ